MNESVLAGAPADSRWEIVEAAARCFMNKGYDRTTIDDIADSLGATKGRVYHHFRSKGQVFFAVYHHAMSLCFAAVEPLVNETGTALERLDRMARAHAMVMMEHLPFQRGIRQGVEIYLRGATTEAERKLLADLIALRDRYEGLFRQVLREGTEDGTLTMINIPIAGRTLLGALSALTDWYRPRPDETAVDRKAIAEAVASAAVLGVAARLRPT